MFSLQTSDKVIEERHTAKIPLPQNHQIVGFPPEHLEPFIAF
jgi:hypothetical protein